MKAHTILNDAPVPTGWACCGTPAGRQALAADAPRPYRGRVTDDEMAPPASARTGDGPAPEKSVVALVVVHGIGAQRPGESLLEWAEPLLRRIDWVSRGTGGDGVDFGAVELSSDTRDEVNARARYTVDGVPRELVLVVSEARWAESFLALDAGEVFRWGASFVWRAMIRLGAHFSRVLWVDPWWRLPGAVAVAALWPALVAGALAVSVLLPLLSVLLLVPGLSALVRAATAGLAEFVGDVAVWTRRPVRAAAMRAVVREGIRSASVRAAMIARDEGVDGEHSRVVLLAHSQGATIAAQTLFDPATREVRIPVDAFITVGATLTLLGSPRWTSGRLAAVRTALAGAGRAVREFNPVAEWARLSHPPRWLNFWAVWDPFTPGPVSDSVRARARRWRESYGARVAPSLGPEEHPVHNYSNPLTDHAGYSANTAQVVDPVTRLLLGLEAPRREDAPGRADAHARSVRELATGRLLVLALAVALGLEMQPWLAAAAAVVGLWLNGSLWRHWTERAEWRRPLQPARGPWLGGYLLRLGLLAGIWLALGGWERIDPWWAALAAAVVLVGPRVGRLPRVLPERHGRTAA